MPANLSPEYKNAEAAYRKTRDPKERLELLREMLRTIPKHKGTEHLQADIKTRIKELTEELSGPRKGAARSGPTLVIRPEGAAQIALIGPPNVGKSSIHRRLTGSQTDVAPYPFTTKFPVPGMLLYEDVQLQLVDLPPVSADFMESWMPNALQPADGALLVLDLADPACVEHATTIRERLDRKKISLVESARAVADRSGAPAADGSRDGDDQDDGAIVDPFRVYLPTLLLAAKSDRMDDPSEELEVFGELAGVSYPAIAVSAEAGSGMERIGPMLFDMLGVVRVYTKVPGRRADKGRPYTVRCGDTIQDVARLVHRDLAGEVRFAKLWGRSGQFDGQQVGRDHPLSDGDVVELHS